MVALTPYRPSEHVVSSNSGFTTSSKKPSSSQLLQEQYYPPRRKRMFFSHRYATICILAVFCIFGDFSTLTRRLNEATAKTMGELPNIYTFYAAIPNQAMSAGMSDKDHTRLLHHWKRLWRQAGWNPVVLTMTDARKHPDFLQVKPWLKETGAGTYNIYCFLRWLAMAHAGGGWMADYDVFPLHDFRNEGGMEELPNNGRLTIHNRLCPSLVSGSADEWTRVAVRMMEYAADHKINSDQKTLVQLYQHADPTLFLQDWSVTQTVFNATAWKPTDCRTLTPPSMRAVHFAHTPIKRALKEGKLKRGYGVQNRAEVATDFMSQWLQYCGRQKFERDGRLLEDSRNTNKRRLEDPVKSHSTEGPKRPRATVVLPITEGTTKMMNADPVVSHAMPVSAKGPGANKGPLGIPISKWSKLNNANKVEAASRKGERKSKNKGIPKGSRKNNPSPKGNKGSKKATPKGEKKEKDTTSAPIRELNEQVKGPLDEEPIYETEEVWKPPPRKAKKAKFNPNRGLLG